MSELAFNREGERFRVADSAAYWRARRVRDRGLEVIYKKDGCAPLTIPIDATEDELRCAVDYVPGKYRLDQYDEDHQPLADATSAYVFVHAAKDGTDETAAEPGGASEVPGRAARASKAEPEVSETGQLLREVVRVNAEITKAVVERLSTIIEATATLVHAADGAGMPARQPLEPRNSALVVTEDDDEDEGDDEDGDVEDDVPGWMRFAKDCIPLIEMIVAAKVPGFAMLRNATTKPRNTGDAPRASAAPRKEPPASPSQSRRAKPDPAKPTAPPDEEEMPEITPEMRSHFMQIYARLTADEAVFAREVANELTQAELAHWMRDLAAMSIEDAVDAIRARAGAEAEAGGVEEVAS